MTAPPRGSSFAQGLLVLTAFVLVNVFAAAVFYVVFKGAQWIAPELARSSGLFVYVASLVALVVAVAPVVWFVKTLKTAAFRSACGSF